MSLSFEKILEQTPKPKLTRSYACCCKKHDESCCRPISETPPSIKKKSRRRRRTDKHPISETPPPIEKHKPETPPEKRMRCLGSCDGCFRVCMIDEEKTHKCQQCEEFTPSAEGLLLKALLSCLD